MHPAFIINIYHKCEDFQHDYMHLLSRFMSAAETENGYHHIHCSVSSYGDPLDLEDVNMWFAYSSICKFANNLNKHRSH
jgi:hypothetical protein